MSDGITDMNLGQQALKNYLTYAMEVWGAKYELQYRDYDKNTWTVPVLLTEERIDKIITDFSIKNIRLQFTV